MILNYIYLFLNLHFVHTDDDSDTATEGEEEIRARELRKQEVRVEPPIDAGTDTEVKRLINNNYPYDPNQCTVDMPDILNNTLLKVSKSSDNLSSNNEQFNSAESEIEEDEAEKPLKPNVLTKSVTTSSITATPVIKRNFVLPPKDRRKSFGKEFVPVVEAEPLLVIKRTPSKINLPPEIGKPKVQVKTNLESAKKYFGATSAAKPPINKPKKSPLIKQASLPEKNTAPLNIPPKIPIKSEEERRKSLFNFEPEESDLQDIDNYIESLMKNEDQPPPKIPDRAEEKVSSSIEDLLKALEVETNVEENEMVEVKPEEKIEDLLSWIEELDHKAEETQITSSLRPDKYKNLESVLKKPEKAENVIHKLCKDNISLFENHLLGKTQKSLDLDRDDGLEGYQLSKSKTDVHCNKRSSVDLDAVKKVDIKKVLQKFENNDNKEPEFKQPKRSIVVPKNIVKRNSFANFTFNRSFEKDDRPSTALLTDRDYNFSENLRKFGQAKSSSQSPQRRQESPSFLRKFRGFKASSESPQRTSITNLLDNSHQSRTNRHSPQRKVVDSAENPCKFLRKFEQFNADLKKLSQAPDVVNDNTSKSPFLRKFDEKFVDGVGISSNRSVSIIDGAAIPPNLSRNEKLSKQDVNRDKINLDGINTATPETGLQMSLNLQSVSDSASGINRALEDVDQTHSVSKSFGQNITDPDIYPILESVGPNISGSESDTRTYPALQIVPEQLHTFLEGVPQTYLASEGIQQKYSTSEGFDPNGDQEYSATEGDVHKDSYPSVLEPVDQKHPSADGVAQINPASIISPKYLVPEDVGQKYLVSENVDPTSASSEDVGQMPHTLDTTNQNYAASESVDLKSPSLKCIEEINLSLDAIAPRISGSKGTEQTNPASETADPSIPHSERFGQTYLTSKTFAPIYRSSGNVEPLAENVPPASETVDPKNLNLKHVSEEAGQKVSDLQDATPKISDSESVPDTATKEINFDDISLDNDAPTPIEENYFQALVTVKNIIRNLNEQNENADTNQSKQEIKPENLDAINKVETENTSAPPVVPQRAKRDPNISMIPRLTKLNVSENKSGSSRHLTSPSQPTRAASASPGFSRKLDSSFAPVAPIRKKSTNTMAPNVKVNQAELGKLNERSTSVDNLPLSKQRKHDTLKEKVLSKSKDKECVIQ